MNQKDLEKAGAPRRLPWFRIVFDQAALTPEIIDHPYPGSGTPEDPYLVGWLENDPRDPMQFPSWIKWSLTQVLALSILAVSFVSSAYSGGISSIMQSLGGDQEVNVLGVSIFVLGFATGPFLWGPLSELYGRQYLFFITYMVHTAFNAGCAGVTNLPALLVLRFIAGTFGASPLTNAGGAIADMFAASERGLAMTLFALAPFLGPVIGPVVGGFVGETVGWRWLMGVMTIFTGVIWIVGTLILPETYAPVLLRLRAQKLSQMTGKVYMSRSDAGQGKVKPTVLFRNALARPWVLLFLEPIVLLLSIYMAIVFGTLYLLFAAFPVVFQQGRGWSPGIGGLAFLGVAVGMLGAIAYALWDNKRYIRAGRRDPSGFAPPEARLPVCMVGGISIPVGLFWFAWTNSPSIHWMASIAAGTPFGFGIVLIFLGITNYMIDAYTIFAASVLAAAAVLRALFAFAFPLFTTYMYRNLGIHWASSIPGFLSILCLPFPFLLYKYGPAIRTRCKYAAEADLVLRKIRGLAPPQQQSAPAGIVNPQATSEPSSEGATQVDSTDGLPVISQEAKVQQ